MAGLKQPDDKSHFLLPDLGEGLVEAELISWRVKPSRASACMGHCIKGWPRTVSMGLGVASVRGRMRSPRPAANTMACAPLALVFSIAVMP